MWYLPSVLDSVPPVTFSPMWTGTQYNLTLFVSVPVFLYICMAKHSLLQVHMTVEQDISAAIDENDRLHSLVESVFVMFRQESIESANTTIEDEDVKGRV